MYNGSIRWLVDPMTSVRTLYCQARVTNAIITATLAINPLTTDDAFWFRLTLAPYVIS